MNSTIVYAKTAQGQDEIATRAHRLPARLRTILIMVDGRQSVAELVAKSPMPEETENLLATLQEGGFISALPQADNKT